MANQAWNLWFFYICFPWFPQFFSNKPMASHGMRFLGRTHSDGFPVSRRWKIPCRHPEGPWFLIDLHDVLQHASIYLRKPTPPTSFMLLLLFSHVNVYLNIRAGNPRERKLFFEKLLEFQENLVQERQGKDSKDMFLHRVFELWIPWPMDCDACDQPMDFANENLLRSKLEKSWKSQVNVQEMWLVWQKLSISSIQHILIHTYILHDNIMQQSQS